MLCPCFSRFLPRLIIIPHIIHFILNPPNLISSKKLNSNPCFYYLSSSLFLSLHLYLLRTTIILPPSPFFFSFFPLSLSFTINVSLYSVYIPGICWLCFFSRFDFGNWVVFLFLIQSLFCCSYHSCFTSLKFSSYYWRIQILLLVNAFCFSLLFSIIASGCNLHELG